MHTNGRYEITIPHDPEQAISVLTEKFPAEKEGILAYFDPKIAPDGRVEIQAAEYDKSFPGVSRFELREAGEFWS